MNYKSPKFREFGGWAEGQPMLDIWLVVRANETSAIGYS